MTAPSSRPRARRPCRAALSTEADPTADRRAGRRPRPLGHGGAGSGLATGSGARPSALPRTVHNEGKGGFAGLLTDMARRNGVSGYPGDGTQRWPAVHALDAAVLFRLALELAPAGTSWHAVADEGDAVHDIATVIGRRLGVPVEAGAAGDLRSARPDLRQPTSPRPARTHERRSAGGRRTRAFSRTWRTSSPDGRQPRTKSHDPMEVYP